MEAGVIIGLPNLYAIGGAAILAVAGMGGAYLQGRSDGRAVVSAKAAAAMAKGVAAIRHQQGVIDELAGKAVAAESQRQTDVRSYHTESIRYVDRPAQRLSCIDPDVGRLLDHATATANGRPAVAGAAGLVP